jgi:RHS repeat-associated protein
VVADTSLVEPDFADDAARSRLFATARTDSARLAYAFNLRPGDWELTLLFAEGAASDGCLDIPDPAESPGPCRVFDILLQGEIALERFSPHVAAQRVLGRPLPNAGYGVALALGPVRIESANRIDLALVDRGPGEPPGDPLLQGVLLRRARPARFSLGFSGGACGGVFSGAAGSTFSTALECTLLTADNPFDEGARGWSISLGAAGVRIAAITVAGTAGAPAGADPRGRRQGGFELSEITSGPGNEGAVSRVILSFDQPATLPPAGSAAIARIEVEGSFPPEDCLAAAAILYLDGRSGSSGPIENRVEQLDLQARPSLGACALTLAGVASPLFRRGDANGDGQTEISDVVFVLVRLFVSGEPFPCSDAADVDDSGAVNLTDAVGLLDFLFRRRPFPAPPFLDCGLDPTGDVLSCDRHDPCAAPPPAGEACPPEPGDGPILTRGAPEPFQFPLLKGVPGRSVLTVRNPSPAPLTVQAISIDPRFDDELFALEGLPALPRTLLAGETLAAGIAGASSRLGLHRLDVRFRTGRGDHVEDLLFEVARAARPRFPEALAFATLPGQPAEALLEIANEAGALADLIVLVDGPSRSGPFSVDPSLFPLVLPPGAVFQLPVYLRFDALTPGGFGDEVRGEIRLRSNGGQDADGRTGTAHAVELSAAIGRGAAFSGPLAIELGGEITRTLVAEAAFASRRFRVRSADPRAVRLRDGGGALADEVRGLRNGDLVTFAGVGAGVADVSIALEPGGGDGGGAQVFRVLQAFPIGRSFASVLAAGRVVRILDGGQGKPDTLEFIALPAGTVVRRHELPVDAVLRGSDLVPVEAGGRTLGLFQLRSGETRIYDFANGSESATVPSPGAAAVPGVDPALARITVAGQERVFGISVDASASLVAYDVATGAIAGRASLADSSPSPALGIGEDVDLLVHGQDGSAIPPALFVMALNGECFAVSLPNLAAVTPLGRLDAGARVAVDPVAMGPSLVSFQDARGEVLFADRAGGGLRTYRRLPRVDAGPGGEILNDSPLPEVDLMSTSDGRFAVQLAAFGHARVLDREKVDPQGSQAGQSLVTLNAPFQARSLIGVDPRIARYSPGNAAEARVICAYDRDVVRIFSLDGARQFTFEPLYPGSGWERNIDIAITPSEERAILRYGEGSIRVVELATGRVLHTIADSERARPIEGVDPRITPDGRFLIDVAKDISGTKARVRIHGVAPDTFGERRTVDAELGLPERDVDIIVHELGNWAAIMDAAGTITVFDLEGRVLASVPGPAGARAVLDVDLGIAREAPGVQDPDEDWVEPGGDPDPPVVPPPYIPKPPDDGLPNPEGDPVDGNPDDDPTEGGGGCVIPGGSRCVCDGAQVNLNTLLVDGIPELATWPIGSGSTRTSVVEIVSHSPVDRCTTRRFQAIRFQGRLIPLDQVRLAPAESCPVPNCGCPEDHWHAANGFDALATDGTRVRDPNPSQCGYGTISEVQVIDIGEETDCSGKVVSIAGFKLTGRAPGTAVIRIRPCVFSNATPAQLANVKPIEVEIVVIRPRRLSAVLQEEPGSEKTVTKSSTKPECLAAACGDEVVFEAEACPSRCVQLLSLGDLGESTTASCKFIAEPLRPLAGRDDVAIANFIVPSGCDVHRAILKCDDQRATALKPIDIHVVQLDRLVAPPRLAVGQSAFFIATYCRFVPTCDPDSPERCDPIELKKQIDAIVRRTTFFLTPPGGVEMELPPPAVPQETSFQTDEELPTFARQLTAPDQPGTWKIRAELGCSSVEASFEIAARTQSGSDEGSDQEHPRRRSVFGDPVLVHSGEFLYRAADLVVPGRGLYFSFERIYKSRFRYSGPLGNNWDHSYNRRLEFVDVDGDGDIDVRHTAMLFTTVYLRSGNGPLDYLVPDGHYKRLRRNPDGTFSLRFSDGEVHTFHGPGAALLGGLLKEMTDRTGRNRMRFEYDAARRLTTIFDVFDRPYTLEYERDLIHKLRDFSGREVLYSYYGPGDPRGSDGDLGSVRTPVVVGTPNGNDFPDGKTTVYTYLSGAIHPELFGNLVSITKPQEVARGGPPYLVNIYGDDPGNPLEFDRVITQRQGGVNASGVPAGGTSQFYYEELNAGADPNDLTVPRRRTVVVDRNGNVESSLFNSRHELIESRRYTGRVSPLLRLPHAVEARGPGLRADFEALEGRPGPDADFFATRQELNRHGEVVRTILPEGDIVERVYGFEDHADPLRRGNLTEERWIADARRMPPGPDGTRTRRRTFTYEPLANQLATAVEFRGHDPAQDGPDADGAPDGPERYRSVRVFDYQEIADAPSVRAAAAAWGIDVPPELALGLGDQNGDGVEGPIYAQVVREMEPHATVLDWDGAALIVAGTQEAERRVRYNVYGQMTSSTDAEENVTEYRYFPARDPDGDGLDIIPGGDAATGGYQRSVLRDASEGPGRNSGRNPPPERRAMHYAYSAFGHVIREIDGRGVTTIYVRNQLDQVVRTIRAGLVDRAIAGAARPEEDRVAPLGYVTDRYYDHNGNLVRIEIENRDSGTGAENPIFDRVFEHDILDKVVRGAVEIAAGTSAVWEFRHDPNENRILVRHPEGNEIRTVWDERDLPLTVTRGADDPSAASTTTYSYDGNGFLRFTIDGEDNDGDGLPETTERVYDGWGRLRRTIDAAGQEAIVDYDVADNRIRRRFLGASGGPTPRRGDGAALEILVDTRVIYDERGRAVRSDRAIFGSFRDGLETVEGPLTPDGGDATVIHVFDRLGRIVRLVDDRGSDALWSYNGLSETILRESAPAAGGQRSSMRTDFDRAGNPFRRIETDVRPDGATEAFESITLFDALSRPVRETDALGQTSEYAWDSRGFLTMASDGRGPLAGPDPTGLTALEINATGNTTRRITDGLGRAVAVFVDLRPGGEGDGLPSFDGPPDPAETPAGLAASAANPDGVISRWVRYDGNSRVIEMVDDRGNATRFGYDSLDRLVVQEHADGSRWEFEYDPDDNLRVSIDPRGVIHEYLYDGLDRQVEHRIDARDAPAVSGTTLVTRQFDGLGRLTHLADDNDPADVGDDHLIDYVYDSLGNAIREVQDGIAVDRRFDTLDNKLSTLYPDAGPRLDAVFDGLDRMTELTLVDGAGPTTLCRTTWAGDDRRRVAQFLGNGVITERSFDGKRRLRSIETRAAGGAIITGRVYSYDRADNRVSERVLERPADGGHEGRTYGIDSQGRMVGALPAVLAAGAGGQETVIRQSPIGDGHRWALDGAGNWVEYGTPGGGARPATFNVLNQDAAQEHDASGNRTADATRRYVFDGLDRLIEVLDPAGRALERYEYDGFGRRTVRRVFAAGGAETASRFIYDADNVIEERDASPLAGGVVTARNYCEPDDIDRIVARESVAGGLYWLHTDVVGSTTAVTGADGSVLERYQYAPYGEPRFLGADSSARTGSAIANPYLFTGRRLDATGLYYFRARFLDPSEGRFVSRDAALDPLNSGNLYSYAGLNPLVWVDPYGSSGRPAPEGRLAQMRRQGGIFLEGAYEGTTNWIADKIWNSPVAIGARLWFYPEQTAAEIAAGLKNFGKSVKAIWDDPAGVYAAMLCRARTQTDDEWIRDWGKDLPNLIETIAGFRMGMAAELSSVPLKPRAGGSGGGKPGGSGARHSDGSGIVVGSTGRRGAAPPSTGKVDVDRVNRFRDIPNCGNAAVAGDAYWAGRPGSATNVLPRDRRGWSIKDVEEVYGELHPDRTGDRKLEFRDIVDKDTLEALMQGLGPGSRAIVVGGRGKGKIGHAWNVRNADGDIISWDFQNAEIPSYEGYDQLLIMVTEGFR